jgi:hypothetical protein
MASSSSLFSRALQAALERVGPAYQHGVHGVGFGNKFALGYLLPSALAPDEAELLQGLHSGNALPINVAYR